MKPRAALFNAAALAAAVLSGLIFAPPHHALVPWLPAAGQMAIIGFAGGAVLIAAVPLLGRALRRPEEPSREEARDGV